MISTEGLHKDFLEAFGQEPFLEARAPGRVNLIGEHTDYNGGFVFPAAIDREMKMLARPREDGLLRLRSANFKETVEIPFAAQGNVPEKKSWVNYFLAVLHEFRVRDLEMPGLDIALDGDVPLGAGLSSSAAYEVCAAFLLNHISGAGLSSRDLALLAQSAEHGPFVGVRCGIMDQYISALGARDHAVLIDCHDLHFERVPFNSDKATIVILNSMKQRGLVDSAYNQRREECETGFEKLRSRAETEIPSIRHLPFGLFEEHQGLLTENECKRLRHNLTENERVHSFKDALVREDFSMAGQLLYASHGSLRDDYEVSCPELDAIVEIAGDCKGVHGCRMTGAGFGGCAVALVEPEEARNVVQKIQEDYQEQFGKTCEAYLSPPAEGATVREL